MLLECVEVADGRRVQHGRAQVDLVQAYSACSRAAAAGEERLQRLRGELDNAVALDPPGPAALALAARGEHAKPHPHSYLPTPPPPHALSRLGVDDDLGDLGQLASDSLLDRARLRVRVGERRRRVEAERQVGDDAFGVRRKRSSRGGPAGLALDEALDPPSASRSISGLPPGLGERLRCVWTASTSGTAAHDRALDLLGDLVRLVERQVAGKLEVEETSARSATQDAHVVHLAHARARRAPRVRALRQLLVLGGSTCTTTSLRRGFADGLLDASAAA